MPLGWPTLSLHPQKDPHMADQWAPSAQIATLKMRHDLMRRLRAFFDQKGLLEVETPILSAHATPDVHLASIETRFGYLHTSPEYPMKRLLAAQAGAIYQICKVFRAEESGSNHNPEFTLLEWYQPGWDDQQLSQQVVALLQHLGLDRNSQYLSYREAFTATLGIDPLSASLATLRELAGELLGQPCDDYDRNTCLDVAMSFGVERKLDPNLITVISDFPAAQAALAIKEQQPDGFWTAKRFEVYCGGLELANGYAELTDAQEQLARFEAENRDRQTRNLPIMPIDTHLIDAMKAGIPACAGVAVGVDRVIMLCLGKKHIDDVLSFPIARA